MLWEGDRQGTLHSSTLPLPPLRKHPSGGRLQGVGMLSFLPVSSPTPCWYQDAHAQRSNQWHRPRLGEGAANRCFTKLTAQMFDLQSSHRRFGTRTAAQDIAPPASDYETQRPQRLGCDSLHSHSLLPLLSLWHPHAVLETSGNLCCVRADGTARTSCLGLPSFRGSCFQPLVPD